MEGVGQDVNLGVAPIDQLAVHPNLAVAIGHRHCHAPALEVGQILFAG
jgi:hypothetical protein